MDEEEELVEEMEEEAEKEAEQEAEEEAAEEEEEEFEEEEGMIEHDHTSKPFDLLVNFLTD